MELILHLALLPVLYIAIHEGGHFLVALLLGCKPKLRLQSLRPVVTYTYDTNGQRRLISQAGFGAGMLAGLGLLLCSFAGGAYIDAITLCAYWGVLTLHFWLYPWTALDIANDFDGMCSHER